MRPKILIAIGAATMLAVGLAFAAVRFFAPANDNAIDLVPPDAVMYVNVFLNPSTEQKLALEDLLAHFPQAGTPDEAKNAVVELIDEALEDIGLNFTRDVEPWLGKQVALFLTEVDEDPDGAVLVATKDEGATFAAIETANERRAVEPAKRSYRGIDYLVHQGSAVGIVDGFLVGGNEPGLKAAVDAFEGRSLADTEGFRRATRGLSSDRLALMYLDLEPVLRQAAAEEGLPPGVSYEELFGGLDRRVAAIAFARSDGLVIEATLQIPGEGPFSLLATDAGPGLLEDMPAESWLAIGGEDLGARLRGFFDLSVSASGARLDLETVAQQLLVSFGFDVERDLFGWMGDFGLFVSGSSPAQARGGVVIESTHPTVSAAGLIKIEALMSRGGVPVLPLPLAGERGFAVRIRGVPEPVLIVDAGKRVIVGLGEAATRSALRGDPNLAEGETYRTASEVLGEGFEIGLLLDLQSARVLVERLGVADDPTYAGEVRPWLEPLRFVVAGTRREGDTVVTRTMIGVR